MKKKYGYVPVMLLLCLGIFVSVLRWDLLKKAEYTWIHDEINEEEEFRETKVNGDVIDYLKENKLQGFELADFITKLYLYEKTTGNEFSPDNDEFDAMEWFGIISKDYGREYEIFENSNRALWSDLKYFPVAASTRNEKLTVSYENSWKFERTFGGNRYHEGCDIMADVNERGRYPVVSISDGVVEKMGWLPQGGYRIGIRGTSGAYFYYAHLESYGEIQVGDSVRAGELLGYMGDSGYGEEGTVGQFAVHLHFGIYIPTKNNKEMSVNPYPMLKFLEEKRIFMDFY